MHINPNKAGIALGGLMGSWHVIWSLLVLLGWGQGLLDLIFKLHMIAPPYIVGPFDIVMAVSLVVVTAVIGYVIGYAFAWFWNYAHRQ